MKVPTDVLDVGYHLGENLVDMARLVADAGYAQSSALPSRIVIHLGDGHVKSVAHPVLDGTHRLTLPLKGDVPGQVKYDTAHTYMHSSSPGLAAQV